MQSAVNALFMNATIRHLLVAIRVPLVLVVALLAVVSIDVQKPAWMWTGLAVSLFGELIQVWCFATLDKRAELACRGPYTMVRNPMYLGRFFIIGGALLLFGFWPVLPLYAVLYWFYMANRVRREERTLAGIFGQSYADYCAGVNRFWPGRPWQGNPVWYWDWSLFRQNHALQNLIGTLAFWACVIGWHFYARHQGMTPWWQGSMP